MELMNMYGEYTVEHIRNGEVLSTQTKKNLIVDLGKDLILEVMFGGDTQINPWYIGLINNSPLPVLDASDTLVSHPGWVEFTDYTGNRQEWIDAAASGGSKGTTSSSTFSILGSGTVYGSFLCGAASGVADLWSEGAFTSAIAVVASDEIKVSYTISWA